MAQADVGQGPGDAGSARAGPLSGLRVVEFGQWIAGPSCGALLADLGADVIKIEKPGQGDDQRHSPPFIDGDSALFVQLNRNKRSLVLDLSSDPDRAHAAMLVVHADVVIDNFRVGVLDAHGLGSERIRALNPRAIYCAISGFGRGGPLSDWAGMDLIAQAMSGVMQLNRDDDNRPLRIPFAVADLSTGLFATIGVLAALQGRQATGQGQVVDVSLLDSLLAMLPYETSCLAATGQPPDRFRKVSSGNAAPYQVYRTGDGWIVIVAVNQSLWRKLCGVLEAPALAEDPRFATPATRIQNAAQLQDALEALLAHRPAARWLELMLASGIPCAPVLSMSEIVAHPHVVMRGSIHDMGRGGVRTAVVTAPFRLSGTPVAIPGPAPRMDQHGEQIRRQLAQASGWPVAQPMEA